MNDSVDPEKRPHMPACTNQNRSLSRSFSPIAPPTFVEVTNHHRHAEATEEHLIMVKPKATTDQIQTGIDVLRRPLKSVLNIFGRFVMQELKFRLTVNTVFTERRSQSRLKK